MKFTNGVSGSWDRSTFVRGAAGAVVVSRGGVVGKCSFLGNGNYGKPEVIDTQETGHASAYEAGLEVLHNTMENLIEKGYSQRPVVFYVQRGVQNALRRLYNATEGLSKEEVQTDDFFESFVEGKSGNAPTEKELECWAGILSMLPKFSDLRIKAPVLLETREQIEARIAGKKSPTRQDRYALGVCLAHQYAWDATPESEESDSGELQQLDDVSF